MRISDWSSDVCSSDLRRVMADYFSQTVIRPDIPRTAMTVLEYKVLSQIFDHEDVGDDVYFCAGHGPNDLLFLELAEVRSEEHTSELQSLMRISYAVFCLKKKK